jgi:hypothetical protein
MSHKIIAILRKTGCGFKAFFVSWHFFTPSDRERYRDMKLHSLLFGGSNPDQTLRVAAGILGKRASDGRAWALQVCCQGCEAFPTMHRTWKPQSGVGLELGDMVKTK